MQQTHINIIRNIIDFVEELTILETFCNLFNAINQVDARNKLTSMVFVNDDVHKKIKVLCLE